jgi:hypothetical protein
LLPARAGSPLAGRVSHPLDDEQSFMKASPPPIPFDQPCLVALHFLLCCRCCQAPLHTFFLPSIVLFDCGDTWPRSVWRLPVALRPLVSNDLLSVRVHTPVTRFFMRLSTRTESPVGGDPTYPTAALQGPEKQRAASTSTKANARLGTDRPLTPL